MKQGFQYSILLAILGRTVLFTFLFLVGIRWEIKAQWAKARSTDEVHKELKKMISASQPVYPAAQYFAHLYLHTTDSLLKRIENGQMKDSSTISQLIVDFGNPFFLCLCSNSKTT